GALNQLMAGLPEHTIPRLAVGPGGRAPVAPEVATLARRLAASGYRTQALMGGTLLTYLSSFGLGFEGTAGDARQPPLTVTQIVDRMLEQLASDDRRPLFLWAHAWEPHEYPSGPRATAGYDANVQQ